VTNTILIGTDMQFVRKLIVITADAMVTADTILLTQPLSILLFERGAVQLVTHWALVHYQAPQYRRYGPLPYTPVLQRVTLSPGDSESEH
jgi:hypothetical protein